MLIIWAFRLAVLSWACTAAGGSITVTYAVGEDDFEVAEDAAAGTTVAAGGSDVQTCVGVDCTTELPYVQILNPTDVENPFGLETNGRIYVAKPELLDFENPKRQTFFLDIAVSYGVNPTRAANQFAQVKITVIDADEDPYWIDVQSVVTIEEQTAATLTDLAFFLYNDEENDTVTCTVAGADCISVFAATAKLNSCSLGTNGNQAFDYETKTSYACTIQACDTGDPTECTSTNEFYVQVANVDDELPTASAATASATIATDEKGTAVILTPTITISDDDSNLFIYTITDSPGRTVGDVRSFEVDPYTGIIRFGVNNPTPKTYYVDLHARDFAGNQLATGVICEIEVTAGNNNQPTCVRTWLYLLQSTTAAVSLNLVTDANGPRCTDAEGAVTFSTETQAADVNGLDFTLTSAGEFTMSLDHDVLRSYELLIYVTDAGTPALTTTITIAIIKEPRNDLAAIDTDDITRVVIEENVPAGTQVIGPRQYLDGDFSERHSEIYFDGTFSGACAQLFQTDPQDGSVYLVRNFNYKDVFGVTTSSSSCDYTARFCNLDGHCDSQLPVITMEIQNVDDTAPIISSSDDYATLDENAPVGTTVYTATVQDYDPATPDVVLSGDALVTEFFELDGLEVKTKKIPDLDDGSSYYFDITLTARDYINPPADVVHVFVEVVPIEEFNPTFDDDTLSATLFESQNHPGYLVTTLQLFDYDVEPHGVGQVTFSITSGDTNNNFYVVPAGVNPALHSVFAEVRIAKVVDFEATGSSITLTITATGSGTDDTATVDITVENVDDVYLVCPQYFLADTINENSPPVSTNVGAAISCTPAPAAAGLIFSSTHPDFAFSGNQMIVAAGAQLDFETESVAEFLIVVSDASGFYTYNIPATVEIQPVNEYQPTFYPSSIADIEVAEDTHVGTVIAQITILDEDKSAGHHIDASTIALANTYSDTFQLAIGQIEAGYTVDVILGDELDIETNAGPYALSLSAADADNTENIGFNIVVTDVNEFVPKCAQSAWFVSKNEDIIAGSDIIDDMGCSDEDTHGTISFVLASDPSELFEVTTPAAGGTLKLKAGATLNYDTFDGQQHVVVVNVIDNTLKTLPVLVVINVDPINQGTPTFLDSNPSINLRETTKPGTCFYEFRMSDSDWSEEADGQIQFTTISATTSTFLVGRYDGIVCLIAPLDFDGGTTSHAIEVRALNPDGTQSTGTNTLTVTITNDNDNIPTCANYVTGTQTENTGANADIVSLGCSDLDGDTTFTYLSDNSAFTVTSTGMVQNTRSLSYESVGAAGYSFYVYVTDNIGNTYGDSPHTIKVPVTITLDPIDEGSPSCITSPEGAITTTVYHATIDEDTPPGTKVTQFYAYDANDKTSSHGISPTARNTFAVSSGQTEAMYFNIDTKTGELFVKSRIDLEQITSPLVLDVDVTDGASNTVTCSVSVTVNDINDNCPVFGQLSYETSVDEETTTMSLTILANDADTTSPANTLEYSIISSTAPSGLFTIGSSSGTLAISSAPDFDIMEDPSYVLVVAATDNSGVAGFCQTTVTVGVTVNPKNDNTPVLNQASYAVSVAENAAIGTVLIDYITATDVDLGADGKLYFEITDSSTLVNINRATGVITLAERLDIDPSMASRDYTIPIAVKDSGGTPIAQDTANVVVTVTDSNDNVPICVSYDLSVSMGERETLPFTTTAEIDCSDSQDSSATLTYAISTVNGMEYSQFITQKLARFSVSAANRIVVDGTLDYSVDNYYVLETHVLDTFAGATLTTTVYVRITIEKGFDVNPEFVVGNGTFRVEVPEDTAVETAIFDLQTAAELENFVLAYIKTSSSENKFAVDYRTGKIYVSEPLDRESVASYQITVQAILSSQYNIAGVTGTSTANVEIVVTDANDNEPIFNPNRLIAKIPETAEIGSTITTLTIMDIDAGDNSEISTIQITSGDSGNLFSVTQDRKVILVEALDYEPMKYKNYTLEVEATDSGSTVLTGTATVFVQVVAVNEHAPVFAPPSYTFSITEGSQIGTNVGSVTATDADTPVTTDGRFYYVISSPTSSPFWVDPNDGKILLKETVDYETPLTEVTLIVEARDFGYDRAYNSFPLTGTASVLIDINDENDNPPTCDMTKLFRASIVEYQTAPTSNVDVFDLGILCSDADTTEVFRQLSYQITAYEPTSMNQLAITSSGFIYLPAGQTISYEDFPNVTLTVEVSDNGGNCVPSTACNKLVTSVFVNIENVNNFAPVLIQPVGPYFVNESVSVGEVIETFTASDDDDGIDGQFDWFIESGNTHQDFKLIDDQNDMTKRTLVTARQLNRERVSSYTLTIVAVDRSTTSQLTGSLVATVNVQDANEPPICLPINYHVTIPEADPLLTGNFIQIRCFDEDSTTSGKNFALLKYDIKSETQQPAGTTITSDFTFQIDTQPPLNRLQVRSAKLPLDYETVTHYVVIVEVADNLGVAPSNTISTTIYIDVRNVNDHTPVFDTITNCAITEAQAIGVLSPTCSITAQDADRDPLMDVTYRITNDQPSSGKFSINSNTGQISLKEQIDTDTYTLTLGDISFAVEVEACDSDRNITSRKCATDTINIVVSDEMDSDPVCNPRYYELEVTDGDNSYLSTPSTFYFQQAISCTDTDYGDTLSYTLNVVTGTAADWEMQGNLLSLKNVADFDAGSAKQNYVIQVIATDTSSNAATATVKVEVIPTNEHAPVFGSASPLNCTISECAAFPATCVGLIFHDDDFNDHPHGQVTAAITAGNTHNAFQVESDVSTNTANVIQYGPVDMETSTQYFLTVTLTDSDSYLGNSLTSSELVNISITGCNDNFPIFNPQLYAVEVADTITDTQPIVTLTATDADVGTGSGVSYSYDTTDTDTNNHFTSLFELTGAEISLQSGQSLTAGSTYRLAMIASDSGGPAREARASVSIYVNNVANSAPVLAADSTVNIDETDSIGTLVATYVATDEAGDHVNYTITAMTYTPNTNPPSVTPVFWMHPRTGQIYTAAPVDYEMITEYELTITAEDNHGATDQGKVTVVIDNINDNVVSCDTSDPNSVIHISWSETSAPGSTYDLRNNVSDIDNPSASFVFTTIAGTDDYDALSGDFDMSNAGIISVVNDLDFERQNKYVFTVRISDNDANPVALTTSCVVEITIQDVNEVGPHFEPEVMFVSVRENTVAPAEVLVLSVVDDDRSTTQGTIFSSPLIESGDDSNVFLIQPNSEGLETLYIQTVLDRDNGTDSYKLIVTAKDTGSPVITMTGTIFVTVLDLNDNPPRWNVTSPPLTITVDECTGIGQTIAAANLSIYAYDLDIGNNSIINYRLQGGAVNDFWRVDTTTGLITAKRALDREGSFTTWDLAVEAYDATNDTVANSLVVRISLSDCNDLPPSVKKRVYQYRIDASVNRDTEVNPVNADDDIGAIKDYDFDTASHGTLTWEITGGVSNDSSYFYVDQNTGNIFTATEGLLLTKNQTNYILYVNVTDGEFEESFNVSIEILFTANLHPPDFTPTNDQYSAIVSDAFTRGHVVLTFSALDNDIRSTFTYSILADNTGSPLSSPTQATDLFVIQGGSNKLEVKDTIVYADVSPNPFEFFVEVSDGKFQDTATVTVTVYSAENNPNFVGTNNAQDKLYAFTYLTDFVGSGISQFVGRVIGVDINDPAGSTIDYSLEETVFCSQFGVDDEGYVYVRNGQTVESFATYWCFVTAFLRRDNTVNNQAVVRIDTCPAHVCALRITIDNPPTYDGLTQYDDITGTTRLLDKFDADMTTTLRTVSGFPSAYVQTVYFTQASSTTQSRRTRTTNTESQTYLYVVAVQDDSTNFESTVGAQTKFIPAPILEDYVNEDEFSQAPFHAGGEYPIVPNSATQLNAPVTSSKKPWIKTAAGIAVVAVACVLGFLFFLGILIGAVYFYLRYRPDEVVETGPDDWEARRNWKKAIRKAMLMARLANAKAIDPKTGRVYIYNKLTRGTRWLKTKDGSKVESNTAINPSHIDDPNPLSAETGEVTTRPLVSGDAQVPSNLYKPKRNRPAPIEEEEEE